MQMSHVLSHRNPGLRIIRCGRVTTRDVTNECSTRRDHFGLWSRRSKDGIGLLLVEQTSRASLTKPLV
jgi:hypothetical protein